MPYCFFRVRDPVTQSGDMVQVMTPHIRASPGYGRSVKFFFFLIQNPREAYHGCVGIYP